MGFEFEAELTQQPLLLGQDGAVAFANALAIHPASEASERMVCGPALGLDVAVAALRVLPLELAVHLEPAIVKNAVLGGARGQLVRVGRVLHWRGGVPQRERGVQLAAYLLELKGAGGTAWGSSVR